ncbi:MAG: DUF3149 domain-containing protein [Rhodocyclaceae bacterium]|nr:DUF3149 domain-containing protein [Rhodocyclaceae bacterium]
MATQELFSTDIGLLSLFTIGFVVAMGAFFVRYIKRNMQHDERTHGSGQS